MPFLIKHEKFEGPLDLLLELVNREELSISDISLARVADEYLQYVRALEDINREELYAFLAVAAELLFIKSRALIENRASSEAEEQTSEELTERLTAYRDIRAILRVIGALFAGDRHMATRDQYAEMEPEFSPPPGIRCTEIRAAYRAATAGLPAIEPLEKRHMRQIVSLEEKMRELMSALSRGVQRFATVTHANSAKAELIVSFLALLELARRNMLELEQRVPFSDILIANRKEV